MTDKAYDSMNKKERDSYTLNASSGCGKHWVWEDPDFITFGNPYLVGIWKPAADQIYLPIPGAATPSTRVSLNLDGKIPEGKDTKKVNLYYLWRGKWL